MRQYPAEFVERVKVEYPDHVIIHRLLDQNSHEVGEWLKAPLMSLNPDDVLEHICGETIYILKEEIKRYRRRLALYYEWQVLDFGSGSRRQEESAP
ncbi:hypothetical protein HYT45_01780 [Candidatus Uhrbacteria bacterium]|nr:hypothetical protein [Candidatus Uhrbacteria bacterium]